MIVCYIGVDVGIKSVRVVVVNQNGKVVVKVIKDIYIWNFDEDFYVQLLENIWEVVIYVVKVCSVFLCVFEIKL